MCCTKWGAWGVHVSFFTAFERVHVGMRQDLSSRLRDSPEVDGGVQVSPHVHLHVLGLRGVPAHVFLYVEAAHVTGRRAGCAFISNLAEALVRERCIGVQQEVRPVRRHEEVAVQKLRWSAVCVCVCCVVCLHVVRTHTCALRRREIPHVCGAVLREGVALRIYVPSFLTPYTSRKTSRHVHLSLCW